MSAERVAIIPECAECERPWLPADVRYANQRSPDDEPPEVAFLLPSVRGTRVPRPLTLDS
jgi:hypothetical protein